MTTATTVSSSGVTDPPAYSPGGSEETQYALYTCATIQKNEQLYADIISETGSKPWVASVGCANWQLQQWPAMFRNVPFAVDSDSRTGGRRIQVHEFPDREEWINEDLGRLRQQVDVSGFVFGDQCDEWAEMLFAACTARASASDLYLPMRVPMKAVCLSVESQFAAEQMGRINFRMTFSIEPDSSFKSVPSQSKTASVTMLQNEVIQASNQVVYNTREDFEELFTGTS